MLDRQRREINNEGKSATESDPTSALPMAPEQLPASSASIAGPTTLTIPAKSTIMGPGDDVEQSAAMSMAADQFLQAIGLPPHAQTSFSAQSGQRAQDAVHAHLGRIQRLLTETTNPTQLQLAAGETILGVCAPRSVQMAFLAPVDVVAVGSVPQRTADADALELDVVLALPSALFQNKDYLDRRYFARRALYLDRARALLSSAYTVAVVPGPSPLLLPCLELRAAISEPHLWQIGDRRLDRIRVQTRIAPDLFVARRLAPLRNALRMPDPTAATPFYNQAVLHEMFAQEHVRWLREWHDLTPALIGAGILARRWLARRRIALGGGFVVDAILAYLHECGRIVAAMTTWQMFRALIRFLVDVDLTTQGVAIAPLDDNDAGFSLEAFRSAFPVTFVGSCGRCNLLYGLARHTYGRVRHEARLALAPQVTFAHLFLDDCSPSIAFDAHLCKEGANQQRRLCV